MAEGLNKKTLWNEAGKVGIILGAICIGASLLTLASGFLGGGTMVKFLVSVLGFIIWAAKFGGCIYVMLNAMRKLVANYPEAGNRDTYILGTESAFLSALIVAAFSMATVMLSPDSTKAAFDTVLSQYSSVMDSNSMEAMDSILDNLPVISFFSNLIYCFVYGWILSAILSRRIPSRNPFDDKSELR